MRLRYLLAALALSAGEAPVVANVVVAPTFAQKMRRSELVVIGTVTAIDRGGPRGLGSTATLSVDIALKGRADGSVIVSTYHPIEELDPRCCELGATYILFLERPGNAQIYSPISGAAGMVRIGAAPSDYRVVPSLED